MLEDIKSYTHLKSSRVLVVDDVDEWREYLRMFLDKYVHFIDEAKDGEEAVKRMLRARLEKKPYDLVFLDLMMPEMNGLRTLKTIRETSAISHTAVIVVTTDNYADFVKRAHELGVQGYVLKPYKGKAILDRAEEVLKKHPKYYLGRDD
ncbi:MAG: response regulator [Planctomycetes bacterium]|nr:response regulator [Planctomycetota bacterium]